MRYESWTVKKAEHWRIDAFELWCWRKLLRVPWTARWSNQPILREISPAYSLEALMLKLKLQYFGHLMWRADSLEKTLMLGKIEGRRRKKGMTGDKMVGWHHWLNGHEFEQAPGDGKGQGSLACCSPWGHKESGMTEQLNSNTLILTLLALICVFKMNLLRVVTPFLIFLLLALNLQLSDRFKSPLSWKQQQIQYQYQSQSVVTIFYLRVSNEFVSLFILLDTSIIYMVVPWNSLPPWPPLWCLFLGFPY